MPAPVVRTNRMIHDNAIVPRLQFHDARNWTSNGPRLGVNWLGRGHPVPAHPAVGSYPRHLGNGLCITKYCYCYYYYYYQAPTGSRLHPWVGSRSTITRDGCDRGGCHLIRRLQNQASVTVGVEGLEAGFHHSILIQSIVKGVREIDA